MAHQAAEGDWTRRYSYAANNNQLEATSLPGDDPSGPYSGRYEYVRAWNTTQTPHLPLMQ